MYSSERTKINLEDRIKELILVGFVKVDSLKEDPIYYIVNIVIKTIFLIIVF